MQVLKIDEYEREIESLVVSEYGTIEIGLESTNFPISAIIPYHEIGDSAPVVWYAIYGGENTLISRVNGRYVISIEYRR